MVKVLIDPKKGIVDAMELWGNVYDMGDGQFMCAPFAIRKQGGDFYKVELKDCPEYVKNDLLSQLNTK